VVAGCRLLSGAWWNMCCGIIANGIQRVLIAVCVVIECECVLHCLMVIAYCVLNVACCVNDVWCLLRAARLLVVC